MTVGAHAAEPREPAPQAAPVSTRQRGEGGVVTPLFARRQAASQASPDVDPPAVIEPAAQAAPPEQR